MAWPVDLSCKFMGLCLSIGSGMNQMLSMDLQGGMTLPTFSFFGSYIQGCIVVLRQLTRHEAGVSDMHVVSHGKTKIMHVVMAGKMVVTNVADLRLV